MCRKAIDGICRTYGITDKWLAEALREMRDKEAIEPHFYEWAENLKIAGDEAVHDHRVKLSRNDARDIIELTGALLAYLFTYRRRFDAFMDRRVGAEFEVTEASLQDLKGEKIPQEVLTNLERIKNQVMGRKEFLNTLKATIGEAAAEKFRWRILKHSQHLPEI